MNNKLVGRFSNSPTLILFIFSELKCQTVMTSPYHYFCAIESTILKQFLNLLCKILN